MQPDNEKLGKGSEENIPDKKSVSMSDCVCVCDAHTEGGGKVRVKTGEKEEGENAGSRGMFTCSPGIPHFPHKVRFLRNRITNCAVSWGPAQRGSQLSCSPSESGNMEAELRQAVWAGI